MKFDHAIIDVMMTKFLKTSKARGPKIPPRPVWQEWRLVADGEELDRKSQWSRVAVRNSMKSIPDIFRIISLEYFKRQRRRGIFGWKCVWLWSHQGNVQQWFELEETVKGGSTEALDDEDNVKWAFGENFYGIVSKDYAWDSFNGHEKYISQTKEMMDMI